MVVRPGCVRGMHLPSHPLSPWPGIEASPTNGLGLKLLRQTALEFYNRVRRKFYNWVRRNRNFPQFLESSCIVVHVLIDSRRYDDAEDEEEGCEGRCRG